MGLVSSSSSASTLTCRTHGYEFARYAPSDYCDISLYDTKGLVGNPTYAAKDNKGERVFDTVFEALKPGTNSDIRVCYYCNFGIVFSNGASSASLYCPYGYGHYVIAYKDVTWYRYNDVFGITGIPYRSSRLGASGALGALPSSSHTAYRVLETGL